MMIDPYKLDPKREFDHLNTSLFVQVSGQQVIHLHDHSITC